MNRPAFAVQKRYNAAIGGNLMSHAPVASDVAYHPKQEHYHFVGLASDRLLKKTGGPGLGTTKKEPRRVPASWTRRMSGWYPAQYTACGIALQGMTVGWGDTYCYRLPPGR